MTTTMEEQTDEARLTRRTFQSRSAPRDRAGVADAIRFQWLKLASTITRSSGCQQLKTTSFWPFEAPYDDLTTNDLFWLTHAPDNGRLAIVIRANLLGRLGSLALWERNGRTGLPIGYAWLQGLQPEMIWDIMGDRMNVDFPEVLMNLSLLVKHGEANLTTESGRIVTVKLPFHTKGLGRDY